MHKRGLSFLILILFSLVLWGCSSGSTNTFHKKLEEAHTLANDMKLQEAVDIYNELMDEVLPEDEYEVGRMTIVSELRSDTERLMDRIHILQDGYHESIGMYEQINNESELDEIRAFLREAEETMNQFGELTHLDIYEDLEEMRDATIQMVENDIVGKIKKLINEALDEEDLASADFYLEELRSIQYSLPDLIPDDTVTSLEERVNEIRDRYVTLPELADRWDQVILESERGTIEIAGINETESGFDLFIYYNDGYYYQADKLKIKPQLIFSDGDTRSADETEFIDYADRFLQKISFWSSDRSYDELTRINFSIPSVQEAPIAIPFDGVSSDSQVDIPGILSIADLHRPDWKVVADDYEVEIDQFEVGDYEIKISGTVIPSKDTTISALSYVYFPFTNELTRINTGGYFGGDSNIELFEGTTRPFELEYSFYEPISDLHDYVRVYLYENVVWVDLKNGQLYVHDEPKHLNDLTKDVPSQYVPFYDTQNDRDLINQSGELVDPESVLIRYRNRHSMTFDLLSRFKTFETTIHVQEDTYGADYGSTEIVFEDNEGNVLHELTVGENHTPQKVSFDISNVHQLVIKMAYERGDEGRQDIILENPVVK